MAQGLELPNAAVTTSKAPAALFSQQFSQVVIASQPFAFHNPPSAVGLGKVKDRKNKPLLVRIAPSLNPVL